MTLFFQCQQPSQQSEPCLPETEMSHRQLSKGRWAALQGNGAWEQLGIVHPLRSGRAEPEWAEGQAGGSGSVGAVGGQAASAVGRGAGSSMWQLGL